MQGEPEEFPSPVGLLVIQNHKTGVRTIVTAVAFDENGMCTHIVTRPLCEKETIHRTVFLPSDFESIDIIGCCFDPVVGQVFHKPTVTHHDTPRDHAKHDLAEKIHSLTQSLNL